MPDPQRRIQQWKAKYTGPKVGLTVADILPTITPRMEAKALAITAMETEVKQVLDTAGVTTIHYPFYLDFGRELFRLTVTRLISGESAAIAAELLIVKWVARELTRSVLENIRTGVFNIPPPTSP